MDTKTSASILERVKKEREKRADGLAVNGMPATPGEGASYIGGSTIGGGQAGRVVGGLGGTAAGGLLGLLLANRSPDTGVKKKVKQVAGLGLGGLAGAVAGRTGGTGLGAVAGGVDATQRLGPGGGGVSITNNLKQANFGDPGGQAFSDALQGMAAGQLKSDALSDVKNIGLASLGVGAAGRGLIGLIQQLRSNKPKKTRSGPAYLPLPYPAEPHKQASVGEFLGGADASTKSGIPWYGPAMMMGGLAGLGLGWKGMDKLLDARRQREQQSELEGARQEFHDALLNQYDEPIKTHPNLLKKKAGDESTMEKVGKALDTLFDKFEEAKEGAEKTAVDWPNLAGQATGGYGMYAGLSGLLTGALVYDKISKRSRRAVLEKALQQRQRRKFMQQPTEIMAVPEPMSVGE